MFSLTRSTYKIKETKTAPIILNVLSSLIFSICVTCPLVPRSGPDSGIYTALQQAGLCNLWIVSGGISDYIQERFLSEVI